jgi:DNA-binding HxlR family transcriptional regulator
MGKARHDCRHSGCGLAYSLDIFGDKWTLVVVRDLIFTGKRYFGEFMASPEKMASNILSDRLKRLEESGIVSKTQDPENESKFIYELTQKGKELIPLVLEIMIWGAKHDPNSNTPPAFLRWLKKDREGAVKAILKCLKDKEPFILAYGFAPTIP